MAAQSSQATTADNPKAVLLKFQILTDVDLMDFPDASWLIDGMIEAGAMGPLYGPSKSGKSFAALDWALCIATGRPWQGREVTKVRFVYIVGEGIRA